MIAGMAALLLHGALMGVAMLVATRVARQVVPAPISQMIEIEAPVIRPIAAADPPVEDTPEEPPPARPTPSSRPLVHDVREAAKKAPAPAAAQAAEVLEAAEELVDFGDSFVTGKSESYAGGVSESGGSAKQAVYDHRARAAGVEGGTGASLRGDLSRPPGSLARPFGIVRFPKRRTMSASTKRWSPCGSMWRPMAR